MLQLFISEIIKRSAFPLYCFCTWSLLGLFLWSLWKAAQDAAVRLRRLHQIPCNRCAFFTGDYRLKCTVHPVKALTEEALNCSDYEPATFVPKVCSKRCQQSRWSTGKNATVCPNSTKRFLF